MVRGKHGFERIMWAFKNVLNHSVTWLFHDFNGKNDRAGPIAQHQPKMKTAKPELDTIDAAQVPEPSQDIHDEDFEIASEFLEWLTLATMCSPRIQNNDKIDTYLSRYQVPEDVERSQHRTQDLVKFQWHGFIPAIFIRSIVLAALKTSGTGWFGMTARSFDGKTYSILQRKHHTMMWEYMD
jgi:ribonuclease P/MRP protein subunit RPP40